MNKKEEKIEDSTWTVKGLADLNPSRTRPIEPKY
jgi:hypothetical protein